MAKSIWVNPKEAKARIKMVRMALEMSGVPKSKSYSKARNVVISVAKKRLKLKTES